MKEYNLITGASSGLGSALALELAKANENLIITGRNKQKLESLKDSIKNVDVEVFCGDLRDEKLCLELISFCESKGIITKFFNNAGLGHFKNFDDSPWDNLKEVIDVNITSFTYLKHLMIAHMKRHNRNCHIISIASMTSFLPLPQFAVYSASKLYVKRLHDIVKVELKDTPIKLHSVYPGGMDTGFMTASNQKLSQKASRTLMTPENVAKKIIHSVNKNKPVIIPGAENKFLRFLSSLFTENFLAKTIGKVTRNFISSST
ncbi:MAG: SDR family NAD(P)-dependent oxidoreductase [Bacteriovoracaceae bacterium]